MSYSIPFLSQLLTQTVVEGIRVPLTYTELVSLDNPESLVNR